MPMPRASVTTATAVNPGARRSRRRACRSSCRRPSRRTNEKASRLASRRAKGFPKARRARRRASSAGTPLPLVEGCEPVEVEAQLLVEPRVEPAAHREGAEPSPERVQRPEGHAVSITRPMAPARRNQLCFSTSRRRWPFAVRR